MSEKDQDKTLTEIAHDKLPKVILAEKILLVLSIALTVVLLIFAKTFTNHPVWGFLVQFIFAVSGIGYLACLAIHNKVQQVKHYKLKSNIVLAWLMIMIFNPILGLSLWLVFDVEKTIIFGKS